MKVLIILAIIAIFVTCRKSVSDEASQTLQKIKEQASQLYKKFDANGDDSVSFEEFKEGVKKGLGFGDDDQSKTYANKVYQKYLNPKNKEQRKSFTEEDFEEIFRDFKETKKSQGKEILDGMKEKKDSLMKDAQKKVDEIYENFDQDKDGHVSFEELKNGMKNNLFGQEKDEDEQSLGDYANQVYEKYVKSDKKDNKHFTRQDFYQIYQDRDDKSLLQKAKQKASEIHKHLDANGDGKISMQELKNGMKLGLGFDDDEDNKDDDEETIKQKISNIYEKYVKPRGQEFLLTLEDVGLIISQKWREGKQMAKEKWQEGKQIVGEKLQSGKQAAGQKLKKGKKTIGSKLEDGKDAVNEQADSVTSSISDFLSEKIDEGSDLFKEFKAKASQIYDKADFNKDKSFTMEELKQSFRQNFGLNDQSQEDQSLMACMKELYQRHSDAGWGDQLKLTKDDFTKLSYYWKQQCPVQKPQNEEL